MLSLVRHIMHYFPSVHPLGVLLCAASTNVSSYGRVFFPQFPPNLVRACPLELADSAFPADSAVCHGAVANVFYIHTTILENDGGLLLRSVTG